MRFRPEPLAPPAPNTRTAPSTAILWCNLGSPDAPTAGAVRRYLAEFLADPRVVEIPRLLWWPILHGIILRTRPATSAAKYASIWTEEGSPLKVWTARQATLLRNRQALDSIEGEGLGSPRDLRRRAFTWWFQPYTEIFLVGRYLLRHDVIAAERFPGVPAERGHGLDRTPAPPPR